jgi:hypothetical protein
MKLFFTDRHQILVFIYFSLGILILTIGLAATDPSPYIPYLGVFDPILASVVTAISALVLFSFLLSKTHFKIYKKRPIEEYTLIVAVAVLFGIEVIAADIWLVDYAEDINVVFPKSLLFYPSIGYVVEVIFHLLPLTLIIFLLTAISRLSTIKVVWISIVAVAVLEPMYQVWFVSENSLRTSIYTGIHVFLFSMVQLLIFKRYDFITMYVFRLIYYSIWHIIWGYFRLELLF